MARSKKRTDGYLCKTFTFNGKRYSVYAKNASDLDKKIYEKRLELEQGKQDHDDPQFSRYYDMWVNSRQGIVGEATLRAQQCHYNTISNILISGKLFKDFRLSKIRADDIRTVQRSLSDSGNKPQTVNDKINFLSHIFSDAVKEQYITYNPCSPGRPLKKTEKPARETIHRALTLDEQHRFFEAAKDSFYYDVFRMAVHTGMRIGEIGALFTSDIYDNAIHINRTITRTESGAYVIGEAPKTWHGKRTIPLNDQIREVLEHQKSINKILDGEKVIGLHETIFKAPERGLLMATPADREIKRICKRTGIEHFTAHALRATFATRAIEQGMAPRTLQEILGYSDYGITMNLYGHVTDDTLENAMNNINIAL